MEGPGPGPGPPSRELRGESPAAASRSRPGAGSGAGPRAEPEPAAARSAAFGKGNACGVSPWGGRGGEGALPPAECPPALKRCSEPHRGVKAFSNGVVSSLPPATNVRSAESTEGTYRLCCYKILLLRFLLFPEFSFLNPLIGEIAIMISGNLTMTKTRPFAASGLTRVTLTGFLVCFSPPAIGRASCLPKRDLLSARGRFVKYYLLKRVPR